MTPSLIARVGMGIVFGTLFVVALTGNVLVCIAIYTNKKLRKKENTYFVSLAGADLLLTVLVVPFAAANDVAGHWMFGEYCTFWMSLDIMCCTCSILHLCAISFDRYYHIHDPMRYADRMTPTKIVFAIALVWTLSITIAFAPWAFETSFRTALTTVNVSREISFETLQETTLLNGSQMGNGIPEVDHSKHWDHSQFTLHHQCSFNLEPVYAIVSSLVSFYVPSFVMIVAYAKLYRYAHRHARIIKSQFQTTASYVADESTVSLHQDRQPICPERKISSRLSTVAENSELEMPIPRDRKKSIKIRFKDRGASDSKARITLGAILGLFILSWLPFFVCNIAKAFCATCIPEWLFLTLTWMGYANSAQNPIIYTIFNRDFRHAFHKILCDKRRCKKRLQLQQQQRYFDGDGMVLVNGHANRKSVSDMSFLSNSTAF